MPYTVQFVGLVCFLRDSGERKVLLPDGRNPGNGIDPHIATIVVAPNNTLGEPELTASEPGVYQLTEPCTITLEGANTTGSLDTSAHDGKLPELKRIDPNFSINLQTAQTIARLEIKQGTLSAFRIPGGTASMSQLDVPHDGPITITITPDSGGAAKTLQLAAGTEIAIANAAEHGYIQGAVETDHFQIYERLSAEPVSLAEPGEVPEVPPSQSQHAFFSWINPIGLSTSCSNTGCCSPIMG